MMGGGPRGLLGQEVSKPVNASSTLLRLVKYFRPYWLVMIIVAGLIIGSTWTQVITPDLTGQSVDCFISPAATSRVTGSQGGFSGFSIPGQASSTQTTSTTARSTLKRPPPAITWPGWGS